ncbi:MAG: hypothetical protein F2839_03905 [Actinobacteria bacterium]|uniref:Unannotated protein n=1 Tax=freshwater metagenome TaxID=449393 RepID=A0A6J5ZAV3_9ZZZZ|nr:hypothetical protein [Actinomycetota bacterium]
MYGRAPFQERVLIPAAVIFGTIFLLLFGGMKLFGMGGSSDAAPVASASDQITPGATDQPSVTPTEVPTDAASDSPTSAVAEELPVLVLNGTSTAGLAKTVSEEIKKLGWTISGVGNWSGVTIQKSVVYYPKGYQDLANTLAESMSAVTKQSDKTMDQNVLTFVVVQ